jgi:hypothetical protein
MYLKKKENSSKIKDVTSRNEMLKEIALVNLKVQVMSLNDVFKDSYEKKTMT